MLNLLKVRKVLSENPKYWSCARCGTINTAAAVYCKECNNRRPW